jgi:hypothetical protein
MSKFTISIISAGQIRKVPNQIDMIKNLSRFLSSSATDNARIEALERIPYHLVLKNDDVVSDNILGALNFFNSLTAGNIIESLVYYIGPVVRVEDRHFFPLMDKLYPSTDFINLNWRMDVDIARLNHEAYKAIKEWEDKA